MKKNIILLLLCFLSTTAHAQTIFVYHPRAGESIKIYNSKKKPFDGKSLHFKQGEKFTIRMLNPNPIFYKYEVKYENQKEESEDKTVTEALVLLNTVLSSRPPIGKDSGPAYDQYNGAIKTLIDDIKLAQQIIDGSDVPELEEPALHGDRAAGLKFAMDQILGKVQPGGKLQLSDAQYRFRSPTLANDLTELMNKIEGLDETIMSALKLLNSSLVQKVNDLKKSMSDIKTEIDSEFIVADKTTKVLMSISAVDPKNGNLARPLTKPEAPMEIVTIVPDFKRSPLELVPVGNFLFAKDVKEFYIENGLLQSRLNNKITFESGVVLNINLFPIGPSKEMSASAGLGYKISPNSNAFENLYFSTLLSYKDFFRVGLGFGFASFPNNLKNGIIEGQAMPSNVENIEDIIEYKEKPTAFLTIAFSGLSLTKKR
jgi:hypothetical protein